MTAFLFLGIAWKQGLLHQIFIADQTGLSILIMLVGFIGLVMAGYKLQRIQFEIDTDDLMSLMSEHLSEHHLRQPTDLERRVVEMRSKQNISIVRYIAGILTLLGVIGTVVGFIIALAAFQSTDVASVEEVPKAIVQMTSGMSTALYTTLVGGVANVWLTANYQLLKSATVHQVSRMML